MRGCDGFTGTLNSIHARFTAVPDVHAHIYVERMTTPKADAPLFVQLELTPEQQRRIREQTGYVVDAIPILTRAESMRCRFGGLEFRVPRGVFVPTGSSERTFEMARDAAADVAARESKPVVVDVGTGAGAIALAIAHAIPRALVFGTELSAPALRAARLNRARLRIRNARFASGSLLSPLPRRLRGSVGVIVANVPYLPPERRAEASRAFPEGTAMGTESDGLGLVRELLRNARTFLRRGGSLIVQVADFQWPALVIEAATLGYTAPTTSRSVEAGPVACRLRWPEPESDDALSLTTIHG